jgi:hypothetical protein
MRILLIVLLLSGCTMQPSIDVEDRVLTTCPDTVKSVHEKIDARRKSSELRIECK